MCSEPRKQFIQRKKEFETMFIIMPESIFVEKSIQDCTENMNTTNRIKMRVLHLTLLEIF